MDILSRAGEDMARENAREISRGTIFVTRLTPRNLFSDFADSRLSLTNHIREYIIATAMLTFPKV